MLAGLLGIAIGLCASPARAEVTKYEGIHPLVPHMGDFCYIDLPHVHAQAPSDMRVYQRLPDGAVLFVGDPLALGYSGPKYAYVGPHPLAQPGLKVDKKLFCYLTGPHYHAYQPSPPTSFVQKDGAYWYVGDWDPAFEQGAFDAIINKVRPIPSYHPPKVDPLAAPPGFHPPLSEPAPGAGAPPGATAKPGAATKAGRAGPGAAAGDKDKAKDKAGPGKAGVAAKPAGPATPAAAAKKGAAQ